MLSFQQFLFYQMRLNHHELVTHQLYLHQINVIDFCKIVHNLKHQY